jgi:hypothetical protein
MPELTMLYYPLIKPPREVLWHALLYWDRLATVVPWKYWGSPRTDPELNKLVERGDYKMAK